MATYMFNATRDTKAFSQLRSKLKKIGFIEGHMNPEYHDPSGITYKDDDIFDSEALDGGHKEEEALAQEGDGLDVLFRLS